MSKCAKSVRLGFTIWEILLVVCIIGFIVAIAIPNFVGSPRSGPGWNANGCINNLRQLDAAAQEFALEHNLTNGDRINFPKDLKPYLGKEGKMPVCPSGGIYHIGRVGKLPICSLGINITPAHVLR